MKTMLAFDDFLLNRTDNTRRVFKQPEWRFDLAYTDAANPRGIWPTAVLPAPDGGYALMYNGVPGDAPIDDEHMTAFLAHSRDGLRFAPCESVNPAGALKHMRGPCSVPMGSLPFLDSDEPNPAYRYKSPCARYGLDETGRRVEECAYLLGSPDLIHWTRVSDTPVAPSYVDCYMSMLKNPVTGRYQVTTRRRWGERRICLVESEDLTRWTPPRCVLHPLPSDEPTTHLYSMPHYYYRAGEIFIGLLWKHVMPFQGISDGPVTSEYAYSYDGLMWNRTDAPIFPVMPRGEYGGGSSYVVSMIEREDDVLFYASAQRAEHRGIPGGWQAGMPSESALIPGLLKRNRFVCIDSGKGVAHLDTQWLRLKSPRLSLNAVVPFGSLRARLYGDAVPAGYDYEDFMPLSGDFLDAPLRWRGGGLEPFVESGAWVRLEICFEQAEVYALSGDFEATINCNAPAYERL